MTEEIHSAYQTLELSNGANLTQVQKAWRKLAMVWHPDRFSAGSDLQREAEERTKQINNAYDILKSYLKDGDIPRSRPRPSAQSQNKESEQRTRQPRSRSSKQSKKQESQKRTRQRETTAEDAHSSQTHERKNRQEQTTKPPQEESFAAIIFSIIFGATIGYFTGGAIVSFPFVLDWMIEAVSGWSFFDRANPWIETFPSKTLIIVPLIVTFLGRIISAMLAEDQRKFIGSAEDWFGYTLGVVGTGTFFGTIGGINGNEIAMFIGSVFGACLGCLNFGGEKENDD